MRRLRRDDSFEDLFKQMEDFFNEFQEFGRDVAGGMRSKVPVDIHEEGGKYVITADLPGVEKQDINVKADETSVEITADVNQEIKEEGENYVRKERSSRAYRRTVAWPQPVDPESIKAGYENGVLTISAEKEDNDSSNIEIE